MQLVIDHLREEISKFSLIVNQCEEKLNKYPNMNKEFKNDFKETIQENNKKIAEFDEAINILLNNNI